MKELREAYEETIPATPRRAAEAQQHERRLADLVNQAYGLTPEVIALMWRTAQPRMPGKTKRGNQAMSNVVSIKQARTRRAADKPTKLYQIKITLRDSKPPIWRRLLVPSSIRLDDLHNVIQATMGWYNSHLHQFKKGKTYYGRPDPDAWTETHDEKKHTLGELINCSKQKCVYEYDFGDNWQHEILLEKIAEPDETWPGHPVCIKGVRACPPEDCGGIWGYYELLETVNNPRHPDHKEMKEWLGPFDPEAFDLEAVNNQLKRRPG